MYGDRTRFLQPLLEIKWFKLVRVNVSCFSFQPAGPPPWGAPKDPAMVRGVSIGKKQKRRHAAIFVAKKIRFIDDQKFCSSIRSTRRHVGWLAADRTSPTVLHFFVFLMLQWGWGWGWVGHVNVRWHLRHEVDATLGMGVGLGGAC